MEGTVHHKKSKVLRRCAVSHIRAKRTQLNKAWEPPTLNQALADQHGPRRLQRILVRASLATTYKYADIRHAIVSHSIRKVVMVSLFRSHHLSIGRHATDAVKKVSVN
jgi:hypothetical protein